MTDSRGHKWRLRLLRLALILFTRSFWREHSRQVHLQLTVYFGVISTNMLVCHLRVVCVSCVCVFMRVRRVCVFCFLNSLFLSRTRPQVRTLIGEMQAAIEGEHGVVFEDGVKDRLCAYSR